jgi:hypothetical protein
MSDKEKPFPVRIDPDQLRRIDRLRGLVPRQAYIREVLLEKAIKVEEKKAGGQRHANSSSEVTR